MPPNLEDSLSTEMLYERELFFVLIPLVKKALGKSEEFGAFGGLKHNLLVKTDIRWLL